MLLFITPILLGVQGESKSLIDNYGVGVSYYPEDILSFSNALKKISKIDKEKFFKNCDLMIEDFNRKKIAIDMINFIEKKCFRN